MFVEYGVLGFFREVGIDTTWIGDVGDDFILALDYYQEATRVEYSSKHEHYMEVHIVELLHASTKKVRDVKWAYGKKNWQLSLELEHLQGIIPYE